MSINLSRLEIKLKFILIFSLFICFALMANQKSLNSKKNHKSIKKITAAVEYLTAKDSKDRITKQGTLSFEPFEQPEESFPTIILDRTKKFQSIIGIGGALTDASAETFYKLPLNKQNEIISALFSKDSGNGFSLGRTNINSCDFSSSSYTYDETAGDTSLKDFSIAHDMAYKIPFIKAAIKEADNDFTLFASPWSPPAWMKTNNDMLHGGKLKPEYYKTWADYLAKFIKTYHKIGLSIWGMTVQNEPMAVQRWESCIYTADEERDFVKNYLGPVLHKSGLSNLKLMIWDHNRGIMYQRAATVYEDPEAVKYVWGTGFHWYVGDHFDNVRLVHDAFPNKHLLFTEGSESNFYADSVKEWKWGEIYGKSMIMDLNNWAEGWTAWNVILDQTGGPNHTDNFCMAPIICNTKTGELTYMSSFYYLGHFSKFIRPGARRIVCSSNSDDLMATAFENIDGKIAVVIMNNTDKSLDFNTWIEQSAVKTKSPAHSIITLVLF